MTPSLSHPRAKRAFTLVELLTVIAIIGVLAAILIPTVGSVMTRVKTTKCANNLRQLYNATVAYAAENNQYLPVGNGNPIPGCTNTRSWQEVMFYYCYPELAKGRPGLTGDRALQLAMQNMHRRDSVLVCPSDEDPNQLGSTKGSDYNCCSYMGSVDVVFSTYGEWTKDQTATFYKRRIDDPRLLGSMMMYADAGKTSSLRPTRYVNTWTPNRHGGASVPPTNNGEENPNGENNVLFFDGHVEALKRSDIPVGNGNPESKRFWAPEHYLD